MTILDSNPVRLSEIRRRLAFVCAVLACSFAVLPALATANAQAAVVQDVHPTAGTATGHLTPPKNTAGPSTRAFWNTTLVAFRNSYGKTVNVAIMRANSSACPGDGLGWQTKGWYVLAPGQVMRVFTTEARYAYYYAEAVDGGKWSGNYGYNGRVTVYDNAFDSCLGTGSTAGRSVGMIQIDTQGTNYQEVNLIP